MGKIYFKFGIIIIEEFISGGRFWVHYILYHSLWRLDIQILPVSNFTAAKELPMGENLIIQVETNNLKRLSLTPVNCHCKTEADWELEISEIIWAV